MTSPICRWCGHYIDGFDTHDEAACERDARHETYRRGAALARDALAAAKAAIQPPPPERLPDADRPVEDVDLPEGEQ